FENRPKLQVNKLMSSIDKILAEMRRNPVSVKFVSKDGVDSDEFAGKASSMFRADEQDSFAQEAYQNASADAVIGGLGAWRLTNKPEDEFEEDGPQRICWEPIPDADTSVYFDLGAKRKDKSDATDCWVIVSMPISSFEEEWPVRSSIADVEQLAHGYQYDW